MRTLRVVGRAGILDQAGGGDAGGDERRPQRGRGVIGADQADQARRGAEGADVVGDVGGAAEADLVADVLDHRHRRLRRDALDAPDRELVEHDVADDDDGPIGDARDERAKGRERRPSVRRHRASASSAVRSDA